jgi:glycosyltransferase involved in cell wall biosynthesis
VPEIIVVDFRDDGCQSTWDIVKEIEDPRIQVIETKYEYMFSPTIAWNLGISQVTSEYVLLLDVDNILEDHFFESNVLHDNEVIYGKPIPHLWGSCLCKKQDIDAINGFNENCIYMGYGDSDLYERLAAAGHSMRTFVSDTLYHKDHTDALTICSQIRQNIQNTRELWRHMVCFNRILTQQLQWTSESSRIRWNLEQLEPRRWLAVRDVRNRSNT